MGDRSPSDGGELAQEVLLAAVLGLPIDGYVGRLSDLILAKDAEGRIRVIAPEVPLDARRHAVAVAADHGTRLVFLEPDDVSVRRAAGGPLSFAVRLQAPDETPTCLRIVVSVSEFSTRAELSLETLIFDFVPANGAWHLPGSPHHFAA